MRKDKFASNWTTDNGGVPLNDAQVERYISVMPSPSQYHLARNPFYLFAHFGMNTATGREWGSSDETVQDFTIKKVKPEQWVKCAKAAGATGLILTCKHHDGFCLWNSDYTSFSVKNTDFDGDIVKMVSDACAAGGLDFGVYLSPWDMHEPTYGTPSYDTFFCNQLRELLTNYGVINEVWFDGAKGANARKFEYDWQRYFDLIRELQPGANIAICGPDIRWVGNEGGKTRKSEWSVVPAILCDSERTAEKSQQSENSASSLQYLDSTDEDLGSRKVLAQNDKLIWYPAEVDVSIRKGWFWKNEENRTVKSGKKLFKLYINSVGKNCSFLLNVPPTDRGVIHRKDARALKNLGDRVRDMTSKPIIINNLGALKDDDGYIEFSFDSVKKLRYVIISEDIRLSQRIEAFDIWIKKPNGKWKKAHSGTVIGSKMIAVINKKPCLGARLVIRQSRSTPVISEIGFYE